MKHARRDYDRIQDPAVNDPMLLSPGSTPIGEHEPVFLLRAQDLLAPEIVHMYAQRVGLVNESLGRHIHDWAMKMLAWQVSHGAKLPDTPVSERTA